MSPTPLSEWADANGVPRRTAYNWAKSGKLNVPLRRTVTGRLLVLDDDEPAGLPEHPFAQAYAEALGLPRGGGHVAVRRGRARRAAGRPAARDGRGRPHVGRDRVVQRRAPRLEE